jgi:hypothetical protein
MTLGDFKGKINGMVLSASLGKAARCGGEGQQRTAVAVKTWALSVKPLITAKYFRATRQVCRIIGTHSSKLRIRLDFCTDGTTVELEDLYL